MKIFAGVSKLGRFLSVHKNFFFSRKDFEQKKTKKKIFEHSSEHPKPKTAHRLLRFTVAATAGGNNRKKEEKKKR